MKTKAGMPIVTIIIIAIVAMVIATIVIFLMLPSLEGEYGTPGPCDDTCYIVYDDLPVVKTWTDCEISNRKIVYWPTGPSGDKESLKWMYQDSGYTSWYDPYPMETLGKLVDRVTKDYEDGVITEGSYHWFTCVAGEID